jgi:enamine deaminase RidA (YjgF/YER057c/UK114 family)
MAAYSRAVRVGDLIAVSGTAATGPDGVALHPGDTYAQTRDCIARAVAAVEELGGAAADVVRTRVYLTRDAEWRDAVRAHAEAFAGIDPANTTLYVAGFIPEGVLVEVELDAAVSHRKDN